MAITKLTICIKKSQEKYYKSLSEKVLLCLKLGKLLIIRCDYVAENGHF